MLLDRRTVSTVVEVLGWTSLALGLAEAIAPGKLARAVGLDRKAHLLRGYGLRELAAGVGLLAPVKSAPALWARAGGDVIDLATLRKAQPESRGQKIGLGIALGMVAAITVVDILAAANATRHEVRGDRV